MPDSSIFLSGSDINTYVGAWVPVSSLTLRREGSQVGSHAHFAPTFTFQARITPEGLTMVRMPWDEELQEAPQPLSTWCSNSTCTPSVGLYGLLWALQTHEAICYSPSLRITLREILSLLSCGFCFPLPSSHPCPTSRVVSFLSACCGTQRQESFQEGLFSLFLLSTSEELELLE